MLKELSHIARGMLFLHGHLARPEDLSESNASAPSKRVSDPATKSRPRTRSARAARCEAALFAAVLGHSGSFR